MKKMVLGLSLGLAALTFLVSPAMAAPALSAADQAFIASLATRPGSPAAVPAAKRPTLGEKALCTATANCGNGTTVHCESNASTTSCSSADRNCNAGEQGHVTCDGATTWCQPACPVCPPSWCTGEDACAIQCDGCQYSYTCNDYPLCTSRCRCILSTCVH